jgi:hypothetical protein
MLTCGTTKLLLTSSIHVCLTPQQCFIYIMAVSFISGVYRTKALLYVKIKISSTKDKFFIIITEKSFLK